MSTTLDEFRNEASSRGWNLIMELRLKGVLNEGELAAFCTSVARFVEAARAQPSERTARLASEVMNVLGTLSTQGEYAEANVGARVEAVYCGLRELLEPVCG